MYLQASWLARQYGSRFGTGNRIQCFYMHAATTILASIDTHDMVDAIMRTKRMTIYNKLQ